MTKKKAKTHEWAPTVRLRFKAILEEQPDGSTKMKHILQQLWTNGDQDDWRQVEMVGV